MADHEEILLELTDVETARFNAKVWNLGPDRCWPWIGSTTWGYGDYRVRGIKFRSNRVAWALGNGTTPGDLDVCHTCDYRRCCNPAHLEAKTHAENVADMVRRGRYWRDGFVYVEPPMPVVPDEVRIAALRQLLVANFWMRVNKLDPDDCWLWTGGRNHNGYGRIEMKCRALGIREQYLAHVLSYELQVGEIPDGLELCHDCDNPPCVNPKHLKPGTHLKNMQDSKARGRNFRPVGERSGRSKLTAEKVVEIRRLAATGMSDPALGRMFGVHAQSIWCIRHRKSWAHIP